MILLSSPLGQTGCGMIHVQPPPPPPPPPPSPLLYLSLKSGNVTDAHALTTGRPVADDDCAQHWTLLSADVGAEGLIVRAERPLETLDVTDWAIVDDSVEGKALDCSITMLLLSLPDCWCSPFCRHLDRGSNITLHFQAIPVYWWIGYCTPPPHSLTMMRSVLYDLG